MAQGTVKWFNAEKGFGFIAVDGGQDVFVHVSAISADSYRTLEEGQRVEFELEAGRLGLEARHVQVVAAAGGAVGAEGPYLAAAHGRGLPDDGAQPGKSVPAQENARYQSALADENELQNSILDRTPNSVPLTIYVREDDDYAAIEVAVRKWVASQGAEIIHEGRAIRGSIRRSFVAWVKKLARENSQDGVAIAGRAAELYGFDQKQAEVDKIQAEAFAAVMTALEHTPAAVIHHGSFLLVKNEHGVFRRELSQLEIAHLRRNPALTNQPGSILDELQTLNETTSPPQLT